MPSATVDFFLKDKETIEAARALKDDWRFARVQLRVTEGDVETAIQLYGSTPSPEIIMIETDTTGAGFIERLGELSGRCEEGSSAVVIGPVNDVNLYRSLTAMGVSDYLVRPVPQETLSEVIAQTLIEKLGAAGSRLIAMIGAKGGVGVSTLAQAAALGASDNLGQKTLLLDAAGAWSSLPVGMGYEPVASTAEVIKAVVAKDNDSLRRMLYSVNDKLTVLASGTEPMLDIAPQIGQFEDVLNTVMASYPVVVADLSGAGPLLKKAVLTRAHEIILVTTPTLASLRAARSLMQEIKKLQGGNANNIDLVLNMAGIAPGKEIVKADIKAALDIEPQAVIAFDAKSYIGAEHEGRKLSADKGAQDSILKILPLIQKYVARDTGASIEADKTKLVGSLLNKLKTKK
ncbi:MAG: type II secretion protein ATPase [Micavibrio aeruginosavorus]|uniref:Type II secretion protein ATPase n=1 Tax=Micavibrio aeruginosavorus TaxID=349221 RepID=A0A2W5Q6C4_9BACT|nr:MAG: type II secretion protein ATPase [Micavibrio aeruginosavorus]